MDGLGAWFQGAKQPPGGAGCLGFPAGGVYPQKFIFVFIFCVFVTH